MTGRVLTNNFAQCMLLLASRNGIVHSFLQNKGLPDHSSVNDLRYPSGRSKGQHP